jgi:hypothetical protein
MAISVACFLCPKSAVAAGHRIRVQNIQIPCPVNRKFGQIRLLATIRIVWLCQLV